MPLRDSAHSASVSRTFLCSWRGHPKLIFTQKTLGLEQKELQESDISRAFISRVDQILRNHSGVGVKTLRLAIHNYYNISINHFNSWLKKTITPGIEKVSLSLPSKYTDEYNFPCSIFLDGRGNSIRDLYLTNCAFRPTVAFDCLRSLTKLYLYGVWITGDELGYLISSCFALEKLELRDCRELICLRVPYQLERLRCLIVSACDMLQLIESKAQNISIFDFFGDPVHVSLGEQVKNLTVHFSDEPTLSHAITKFPSTMPRIETLTVSSYCERVDTPMVDVKFLHLKHLHIFLYGDDDGAISTAYDYLSLGSFLDASPVLESFVLSVDQDLMMHDSLFENASPMRRIPDCKHDRLTKVQIDGFCSAKSMVELTCCILENATSLESLTLDCLFEGEVDGNNVRCASRNSGRCRPISRPMILEAHKALSVIKRYILERVPSTVKLNVGEPCSRCYVIDVEL